MLRVQEMSDVRNYIKNHSLKGNHKELFDILSGILENPVVHTIFGKIVPRVSITNIGHL